VADDCDCRKIIDAAAHEFGRLDILVNNAGTTEFIPHANLDEVTDRHWERIMAVNVRGPFQCTRAARRHLEASGAGLVINVASVAGLQGYPNEGIYCASKFAQMALTQSLDREFFERNIKVTAVCPGGVETFFAIGDGRTAGSAHNAGFSTAEDVAEAVVMAALPRARSRIVNIIMRPMNEQT